MVTQRDFAQADQAAARQAEVRQRRLDRLEAMFLTLGVDVLQLGDGTLAAAEFMDARSLAAGKWSRLLDLEGQVQREAARLAARSKTRPSEPADQMLADEVVRRLGDAYAKETDGLRVQLHAEGAGDDRSQGARGVRREVEGEVGTNG